MTRFAPALIAMLFLSAAAAAQKDPVASPRKQAAIKKLKEDIYKVDRSIEQTEVLISRSRTAPYLPDLRFRLCELYVEKSRYLYFLQAEQRPESEKGALVSPETRLLKEKAVSMYDRLLREFPDYKDADKVRFYMAHEQRELGLFTEMVKSLGQLVAKHEDSPLRLEAEQIIGDHFFDKADLEEAERHYMVILKAPESPVHDLARYKMGWVRVNQTKHKEAVEFFEAAASSPPPQGVDAQKALNVKRESLLDAVYSYTESRPGKLSLPYFEKLSDSRSTYALALEKLATRYTLKQQPWFAVPALRKLLEIKPDSEMDLERAQALYDQLKQAKKKLFPTPTDVKFLVRAAVGVRTDSKRSDPDRKKELAALEEMARDLATQIHVAAQQKDDSKMYALAADAYGEYLTLFRPQSQLATVMRNRADALYASNQYVDAARQFEELARAVEGVDQKKHESALYGALLAHRSALGEKELDKRTQLEPVDSRQALKLVGSTFTARYPNSERVAEVKFNIARAYFDDGAYTKSGELFAQFALDYPEHKDATAAGHLALDSYRQIKDFKKLESTGKRLLASRLPDSFQAEAKRIMADTRGEELQELVLDSADKTGDVISGLLQVADSNKGTETGQKALFAAMLAAREKLNLAQEKELATRFMDEYPNAQQAKGLQLELAKRSAQMARFTDAADGFEKAAAKLEGAQASEALASAGTLRVALGDTERGVKDLEAASKLAPGERKLMLLEQAANAYYEAGQLEPAMALSKKILAQDRNNALAASIVAEAAPEKAEEMLPLLASGDSEESARGLWHVGERMLEQYLAMPAATIPDIQQKAAALGQLRDLYAKVIGMGSAEYGVASLWRTALAHQNLAVSLEKLPLIEGGEEASFREAVKEQAAPYRAEAKKTFAACKDKAEKLGVYTSAALGCRTGSVEAEAIVLSLPKREKSNKAATQELQKAVERTADAKNLAALGVGYLEARKPKLARLTLTRAVELDDLRSEAHSALGLALLQLGKPMDAAAAYKKALEMDPNNDKARANLAALKCRVGDREGGKKELSEVKDQSSLNGPDLDPDWRTCNDALSVR
jgi:tetratricopeptide (TPR) repeat protein